MIASQPALNGLRLSDLVAWQEFSKKSASGCTSGRASQKNLLGRMTPAWVIDRWSDVGIKTVFRGRGNRPAILRLGFREADANNRFGAFEAVFPGHLQAHRRADLWALLRVSAHSFFVLQIFTTEGLLRTTAGNTSYIMCLLPVGVMLLCHVSKARTGGIRGSFGLAQDPFLWTKPPARSPISPSGPRGACRATESSRPGSVRHARGATADRAWLR